MAEAEVVVEAEVVAAVGIPQWVMGLANSLHLPSRLPMPGIVPSMIQQL